MFQLLTMSVAIYFAHRTARVASTQKKVTAWELGPKHGYRNGCYIAEDKVQEQGIQAGTISLLTSGICECQK